jgi:hypothetical protein
MAFLVYGSADGAPTEYGDRASYSFNQAGYLVVVMEDGTRHTFAPHAWHHIEDRPKGGGFF